MSPARFRWGMLLILAGLLLFFQNLDILNSDFWYHVAFFVPILLIAIGIEKIFTKTKLQFISYLTSIVILAGGLLFAFSTSIGDRAGDFFSESEIRKWNDENVKRISAELKIDDGILTIRDSGDDIVYAQFDRFTRKPDVKYDINGDTANIKLLGRSGDFIGGIIKIETDNQEDWMVSFSRTIPLDFTCRGNKADVHLNLATTPLENLVLDMRDSYIYLKLGDLIPQVSVKINGSDSKLKLRVPEHVGVRINADDYSSYFEKVGMKRSNGWFISGGIDTLKSKVDIEMDAKLNSFSIEYF